MSELRKDLVSDEWVVFAPERAKRPHAFSKKRKRIFPLRGDCPFEDRNIRESGSWPPILSYPNASNWRIIIVPNRYPVVEHHEACTHVVNYGPYKLEGGIGHHDLLITRNHTKGFGNLKFGEALEALRMLQMRYKTMVLDSCLAYTSAFFNWGKEAGATVAHPHCQILTLPIIPPHVASSLRGANRYYKAHKRCAYCVMVDYEIKEKVRVIKSLNKAIAIAPFASREPYEIKIFPKRHLPYFERAPIQDLKDVAYLLQFTLKKIKIRLGDPDFNFFIHSAPVKNQNLYRSYHWHIEIVPKLNIGAGFELSTGLEINSLDPDKAAELLRA